MHRAGIDHVGIWNKWAHDKNVEHWFGCEYPERPYDKDCVYISGCDQCVMHARAAVETGRYLKGTNLFHTQDQELPAWVEKQMRDREAVSNG
jgi:hypothetical protein